MRRDEALLEAGELICGDRQKAYGDSRANHQRIASVWGAILGFDISAEQVVLMMAGLKLARLAHNLDHGDSWVDLIGYAALGAEMSSDRVAVVP